MSKTKEKKLNSPSHTLILTLIALIAFAGNSVLCRLALTEQLIDASSFSYLRLFSGSITLLILVMFSQQAKLSVDNIKSSTGKSAPKLISIKSHSLVTNINKLQFFSALCLFTYCITFSFAYITLETGTGALVLFGAVQLTMFTYSLFKGEQINHFQILGILIAFSGLLLLVFPALTTPELTGFMLMFIAGIAWAFYTLAGKKTINALKATQINFLLTLPIIIIVLGYQLTIHEHIFNNISWHLSFKGVLLALSSGVLTSAIGYFIWFKAVKGLTTIQSGAVQLSVPLLAAFGGIVFSDETLNLTFVLSSILILSGLFLVLKTKQ